MEGIFSYVVDYDNTDNCNEDTKYMVKTTSGCVERDDYDDANSLIVDGNEEEEEEDNKNRRSRMTLFVDRMILFVCEDDDEISDPVIVEYDDDLNDETGNSVYSMFASMFVP